MLGDAFDAGAAEAVLGHDVEGRVEDLGAPARLARHLPISHLIDHSIECTMMRPVRQPA